MPIQTPPEPKQETTFGELSPLMKIFDVLQRGQYTTAGFAEEFLKSGDLGSAIGAGYEGLMGRNRASYKDVLTQMGWSDEDSMRLSDAFPSLYTDTGEGLTKFQKGGIMDWSAKGAVGLAGDIALDPLTYLGVGAFGKGAKGINVSRKALPEFVEKLVGQNSDRILSELLPKAVGDTAFEAASKLSKKLSRLGISEDITEELSKHLVSRNAVSFFGKQVLPDTINDAIVDTFAKGFGYIGDTVPGQYMKNLFKMGGDNEKLRHIMQGFRDASSSDKHKFEMYVESMNKIRKSMDDKQMKLYNEAIKKQMPLEEISDPIVKQAVSGTMSINGVLKEWLDKTGLIEQYGEDVAWNLYHQPKVLTPEGKKMLQEYGMLGSTNIKKRIGKMKKRNLVYHPFDPASVESKTVDIVFDNNPEMARVLNDRGIIFKRDGEDLLVQFYGNKADEKVISATKKEFAKDVRRWSIDESNDFFRDYLKKKGVKFDGDMFYNSFDAYMPARYFQTMRAVRKQEYLDNLISVFHFNKGDIMGWNDFIKDNLTEGNINKEGIQIMTDRLKETLNGLGMHNSRQVGTIINRMKKQIVNMFGEDANMETFANAIRNFSPENARNFWRYIPKGSQGQLWDETIKAINSFDTKIDPLDIRNNLLEPGRKFFFNLNNRGELYKGMKALEKEGFQPGVYVKGDDWVKFFKESGITGARMEKLQKMVSQGEGLNLSMEDFESLVKEFPGISTNIRAYVMDKGALDEMTKTYDKLTSVEEMRSMAKVYKDVYNWWKGMALLSPGYHFRNMISNFTLNYLGDVNSLKWYKDALDVQLQAAKGNITKGSKWHKLYEEMIDKGVIGKGFFDADVQRSMAEILDKPGVMTTFFNAFSPRWGLSRLNKATGSWVENNARIAHYIAKRSKGFGVEEAANSVKKFLFDYGDLSEFEQKVMKNIIPFYTFMRKNIPLQMEMTIKKPGKQAVWGKLVRAAQGDMDVKAFLPEWMKEQGGVEVGKTSEGQPMYFPLQSYLPFANLTQLDPRTADRNLVSMINPMYKLPMESVLTPGRGYSFYFGKPLEAFEGETENFMGFLNMRKKYTNVFRAVRMLNEIDRLVGERAKGLSPGARINRLVTGMRLYPYNEQKEMQYFLKDTEREIRRVKSLVKYKSPEEQDNLRNKIRDLQQLMRDKFTKFSKEK